MVQKNYKLSNLSTEIISISRLSDRVEGSPSTDFSSIYIGCYDNHVYSLSLSTGEVQWRFKTQVVYIYMLFIKILKSYLFINVLFIHL